jgi:ribonuclease T2
MKKSNTRLALVLLFHVTAGSALLGVSSHHRARHHEQSQPGVFDYYVLALSWSPEFCHSHPSNVQCSGHSGFVVHGLWPQFVDGYPEHCSTQPGPANPSSMADIMPDPSLVVHEWATHGTCSGLDAEAYFKLVRQAFGAVHVPARLAAPRQTFSMTPRQIKEEFVAANPRLRGENLTVSCGNNYLTGVSVCLSKQLQPTACEALRDCRANSVKIAPVRLAGGDPRDGTMDILVTLTSGLN